MGLAPPAVTRNALASFVSPNVLGAADYPVRTGAIPKAAPDISARSLFHVRFNPYGKCRHKILQELARGVIIKISTAIEQLVGASDVRLRLLHCRNVQKHQRLPQVMVCAEAA